MPASIIALVTSSMINILMLLILLYLVSNNIIMSLKKTKTYMAVIIFTIIVIIAEIFTNLFDTLGRNYRVPNMISNIVGFSLSTYIPILLAIVFDENLYKKSNYIYIPTFLNFVFTISSPWTGWIFWISPDNQYMRGPFFSVYIITSLFGLLLLMISNYKQSLEFQNKERFFLLMLYLIILVGITIQVLFPNIHTTWHCVSLVLVMYYLFQRELQFKYDILTKMLNRQAFESMLKKLEHENKVGIALFDLDMFKSVNDTYGHAKGDDCLKVTAEIIAKSFKGIGECYRVGGDEFCVFCKNANENTMNECIEFMLKGIKEARKVDPIIPIISHGYSIYNHYEQKAILESYQEADKKMYECKNNRVFNNLDYINKNTL